MVSSQGGIFNIVISTSNSLTGPFLQLNSSGSNRGISYKEFESSQSGYSMYGSCRLLTYNAKEQPVLEMNGDIVISYNVNGCEPDISLANYWPRFIVMSGNFNVALN